jgi:hypothetical protein
MLLAQHVLHIEQPKQADPESERVGLQIQVPQMLPTEEGWRLHTGCTGRLELPPDLAQLVNAWARLPEHVRRAILTLADGCK